ncbi:MAG: aspartate/glutamate racemase family protein [Pseudomonadota bacterium]
MRGCSAHVYRCGSPESRNPGRTCKGASAEPPVPFLSIVEASCAELAGLCPPGSQVGLIGTRATLATGLFDATLERHGYAPLLPSDAELDTLVLPAIERVKADQAAQGGPAIEECIRQLQSRGAAAVVLACTETPLALDAIALPLRTLCIDTNAALACVCLAWWRANGRAKH